MGSKERYLIFGIGVFIGCMILAISYTGKYNAVKKQREKDVANGYKSSKLILPGQDLKAKKPFDLGPALLSKDLEQNEDGNFARIIIAKGSEGKDSIWRIVETLWKDPEDSTREKLVLRQIMAADRVIVRLKEDHNDVEALKQELSNRNMEFLGVGRGPRLYKVKLATYDIDAVDQAIEFLTSKSKMIEAVFPDYHLSF